MQALGQLRDQLSEGRPAGANWEADLQRVQARCRTLVNEYFRVRLFGLPQIADFVAGLQAL